MEEQQTRTVADAVMAVVRESSAGCSPNLVRERLGNHYSETEVRSAIARLWDEGQVNVGQDKRIRATGQGTSR